MKSTVILDYHLAAGRVGYLVRALLKFEGEAPQGGHKSPLNLSIVLDRSGSMMGEKLRYAREAAALLVRRLRPDDVVSVVAYDNEVITVAEPATGALQQGLPAQIGAIEPGGSTNLSGGWLRGRALVARPPRSDSRVNRVLLLTDGLANVGITDPSSLKGLCNQALEDGVTTSTIGFGSDYDEELLRAMAEAGGGHSYYIENADQAPGVFEEEIEGLLSLSAQNIEVKIAPEQFVELVNVHNDYASHAGPEGITVSVGDLYARDPKSLLIEFFVPELGVIGDRTIAEISVSADVIGVNGDVTHQVVRIPVASSLQGEGSEEPEIQRTKVLLDAAKAREEARDRGRRGDFGGAAAVLREASAACMASPELQEHVGDLADMALKYENRDVSQADEKYLYQRAYNARRGKALYEEKISRPRGPR